MMGVLSASVSSSISRPLTFAEQEIYVGHRAPRRGEQYVAAVGFQQELQGGGLPHLQLGNGQTETGAPFETGGARP